MKDVSQKTIHDDHSNKIELLLRFREGNMYFRKTEEKDDQERLHTTTHDAGGIYSTVSRLDFRF
jgi:hypothetical protein